MVGWFAVHSIANTSMKNRKAIVGTGQLYFIANFFASVFNASNVS